jgi:hypothetical protein
VVKGRADLPLAHPLRNDEDEVRKPDELLLFRPPRREPEVALELPRERAERLGAPVVLEVELARSTGVQVPPEPVRLDLGGPCADPVLGSPGRQVARQWLSWALEASTSPQKNALTPRRWARFRLDR